MTNPSIIRFRPSRKPMPSEPGTAPGTTIAI
jgi:hypothetical protein